MLQSEDYGAEVALKLAVPQSLTLEASLESRLEFLETEEWAGEQAWPLPTVWTLFDHDFLVL